MYTVSFSNVYDVRMGSPYNIANVSLKGDFIPDLGTGKFQDKYAVSDDGKICILIKWNSIKNNPGFILWRISEVTRDVKYSDQIMGCCDEVKIVNDKVVVTCMVYDSSKKVMNTVIRAIEGLI